MNKKMYNAPEIKVVELEASSIMAGSLSFKEQTNEADFSDAVNATTGDAGTARVASSQYFDTWSDDEE